MTDFLVRLNDSWRVTDDPPQWVIEQRIGNPSAKSSGWRARKFIRATDHLLTRIAEICGAVDPAAIATIQSWPSGYVTWKVMEMRASAGPGNAPYSAERASDHLNITSTGCGRGFHRRRCQWWQGARPTPWLG